MLRGDLDLNGSVDMSDVALLLGCIGEPPVSGIGDLDADGVIGLSDVAALLARRD